MKLSKNTELFLEGFPPFFIWLDFIKRVDLDCKPLVAWLSDALVDWSCVSFSQFIEYFKLFDEVSLGEMFWEMRVPKL